MEIKTRFAPSPTGYLHVGGARTALFSWLYARHNGGRFVLRIEDTDLERSTQEATDAILESMKWLGLTWDEGPFYQTKRLARYREVIDRMLKEGTAYRCYCTKERLEQLRAAQQAAGEKTRYDGRCRDLSAPPVPDAPYVVRFKNPRSGSVVFDDMIKGRIEISNSELDDFVLMRQDGMPTYNFCVVVDDWDMGITHVIRGDDHVNNTPKQINLYRALGAPVPVFGHLAMILGPDGAKLSKRHGAVSVMQYRDDGYLPEALLNYLARLGWSHGDDEIFTLPQLIELFTPEAINKSASAFNFKKLDWLNAHYMKTLPPEQVGEELRYQLTRLGLSADEISRGPMPALVVEAYAPRCRTLKEMAEKSRCYYQDFTEYDRVGVKKWIKERSAEILKTVCDCLGKIDAWEATALDEALAALAQKSGLSMTEVGQPMRLALTGSAASPGIGQTLCLTGRERALERLGRAADYFASFRHDG